MKKIFLISVLFPLFISSCNLMKPQDYNIYLLFDDVHGLEINSEVRSSGLKIGEVSMLDLYEQGVIVELSIQASKEIPMDSEFRIRSLDLMGTKIIDIEFSDRKRLIKDMDTIQGVEPYFNDFKSIIEPIENTMNEIKEIIKEGAEKKD